MDLRRIVEELRARRVSSVAVAYAVGAWVAIQVADTVLPRMYLPDWMVTAVIVAALLGFPVALVLAWYFDVVPAGETVGRPGRGWLGLIAALLSLLLVLTAAAALWPQLTAQRDAAYARGDHAQEPVAASLLVLPFMNLGPDDGDRYFADGVTAELIGLLGRLPGLQVVGRTSAFAVTSHGGDGLAAAESLGVSVALRGTVRRAGTRVRVVAELVDPRSGAQIWSDIYDREIDHVLGVQEEIARAIGAALNLRLPRGYTPFVASKRPDAETYDLYLRARHAWRTRTPEGLELAIRHFTAAIERDSTFAEAYAGLADTHLQLVGSRYGLRTDELELARAAVQRALDLEPGLAEALATRGLIRAWHDRQSDLAEADLRRAIELEPRYATAHHYYGGFLAGLGRFSEAIREFRIASTLDPLAPTLHGSYAVVLWLAGDLDAADAMAARAIDLAPGLSGPWVVRSKVLASQGRTDEAIGSADRALALDPNDPITLAAWARAHGQFGDRLHALRVADRLRSDPHPCVPCVAEALIAVGNIEGGLEWLRHPGWRSLGTRFIPERDPLYDPLRRHPEFLVFLDGLERFASHPDGP